MIVRIDFEVRVDGGRDPDPISDPLDRRPRGEVSRRLDPVLELPVRAAGDVHHEQRVRQPGELGAEAQQRRGDEEAPGR